MMKKRMNQIKIMIGRNLLRGLLIQSQISFQMILIIWNQEILKKPKKRQIPQEEDHRERRKMMSISINQIISDKIINLKGFIRINRIEKNGLFTQIHGSKLNGKLSLLCKHYFYFNF